MLTRSWFFAVLALSLSGCVSEDARAWRAAQADSSASAFRNFIDEFPDSPHSVQAKQELERLSWEAVTRSGAIEDYEKFVAEFPESERAEAARKVIENARFPLTRYGLPDLRISSEESFLCGEPGPNTKTYEAVQRTRVSTELLQTVFGWNGEEILWKWSDEFSGIRMQNGSVFALSAETVDPKYGIPFEMGFAGEGFGDLCVGNLQTQGTITFVRGGLELHKGTKLTSARVE